MKFKIRIVSILAGIAIFCTPIVKDRYESYQQQQILAAWEQNLEVLDTAPADSAEAPEPLDHVVPAVNEDPHDALAVTKPSMQASSAAPLDGVPVEGLLLIDKIKLRLPIITDATPAHLKLSVASMLHTGKPGEIGNYAIAGHRNRTFGKNFNRLDELKIGDTIQVQTAESTTYTYVIDAKTYVLPTEVSVLEGNGKDSQITLITCHPMKNPTKRLIVKGTLVETKAVPS